MSLAYFPSEEQPRDPSCPDSNAHCPSRLNAWLDRQTSGARFLLGQGIGYLVGAAIWVGIEMLDYLLTL